MARHFLFVAFVMVACGGEVTGPLEGDGGPPPSSDAAGHCTKNADCPTGEACGFAESSGCSATGQCLPMGAICNSFMPGCSCAGQTINMVCSGLPDGYTTAPLAAPGACPMSDAGGGPQFPCGSTFCFGGKQYCDNGSTCVSLNGCTSCSCVVSMLKCAMPTCSQVADSFYVTCQ